MSWLHWLAVALVQAAALTLYWYHPRWWVGRDVRDFNRNPADDTFHGKFHRQRGTWRVSFVAAVALAAVVATVWLLPPTAYRPPAGPWLARAGAFVGSVGWQEWTAAGLLLLGLVSFGTGYFFYYFNPALSVARKLPYVSRYYVSLDPAAAWLPDRYVWTRVCKVWPELPGLDPAKLQRIRQDEASRLLPQLLFDALVGSSLIYLVTLISSAVLLIYR